MNDDYSLILMNTRDSNEADYIIDQLFEKKLVACIQTNKVHSHYFLKGKVMHDNEIRLLIKTKRSLFKECEELIRSFHSYEIPEIIEIPITNGSKDFFEWVDFATRKEGNRYNGINK